MQSDISGVNNIKAKKCIAKRRLPMKRLALFIKVMYYPAHPCVSIFFSLPPSIPRLATIGNILESRASATNHGSSDEDLHAKGSLCR